MTSIAAARPSPNSLPFSLSSSRARGGQTEEEEDCNMLCALLCSTPTASCITPVIAPPRAPLISGLCLHSAQEMAECSHLYLQRKTYTHTQTHTHPHTHPHTHSYSQTATHTHTLTLTHTHTHTHTHTLRTFTHTHNHTLTHTHRSGSQEPPGEPPCQ